jgi:hypothetical protein
LTNKTLVLYTTKEYTIELYLKKFQVYFLSKTHSVSFYKFVWRVTKYILKRNRGNNLYFVSKIYSQNLTQKSGGLYKSRLSEL